MECTDQTEVECLERMLFGAPRTRLPEMKQHITVGTTVFLYNKHTKVIMGPYTATSEPGLNVEKDAWSRAGKGELKGSRFPAQVRVQAQGAVKRLTVRNRDSIKAGPMTAAEVEERQGTQRQQGTM